MQILEQDGREGEERGRDNRDAFVNGVQNALVGQINRLVFGLVDEELRKRLGTELADIIKLHARVGAATAAIPVPGADIAAFVANIWTMYIRISRALNLPFSDNILKSIAISIATNVVSIMPSLLITRVGGMVLKFIPGVGSIAGIASSVVIAATNHAIVRVMALIYIKALTTLISKQQDLTDENLQQAVRDAQDDKYYIKTAFKEAREEYKTKAPVTREELPDEPWAHSTEFPPINIWRGSEGVIVTAQIPGIKPDDIELTLDQNTLTIKGRSESEAEEPEASPLPVLHASALLHERTSGSFARTIALPFSVDTDQIIASAENGILTVELPRLAA